MKVTNTITQLVVTLFNKSQRFDFGNVDEAVSEIHAVAKRHGYSCLVDYIGDDPQLSWTLVRMSDNHTVGRAFIR
jgi:hypothetical protein